MFLLDDDIKHAISLCITHGIPFAVYAMPGDAHCSFIASDPRRHTDGCAISPAEIDGFNGFLFNRFEVNDTLHAYGIRRELSSSEAIALADSLPEVNASSTTAYESTGYESYRRQVESITAAISSESEKVVLSHVVTTRRHWIRQRLPTPISASTLPASATSTALPNRMCGLEPRPSFCSQSTV